MNRSVIPSGDQSSGDQSSGDQSSGDQLSGDQSSGDQSSGDGSTRICHDTVDKPEDKVGESKAQYLLDKYTTAITPFRPNKRRM